MKPGNDHLRAKVLEHIDAKYVGRQLHDDQQCHDERAAPAYLSQHLAIRDACLYTLADGELNAKHHYAKDACWNNDEGNFPLPAYGVANAQDHDPRYHETARPTRVQNVEPLGLVVLIDVGNERVDDRFHRAGTKAPQNAGPVQH